MSGAHDRHARDWPRIRLADLPPEGRRPAGERWRHARKSRRKGRRDLFVHEGRVYKIYDPDGAFAHRMARIAESYPVVLTLASLESGVPHWDALLVDERDRVVGYRMPRVAGRPAALGCSGLSHCRELYLRLERRLARLGLYWQDPKLSNFLWNPETGRAAAVDLKQILPVRSAGFDPDAMLNSPRASKLHDLGLGDRDLAELAELRRQAWGRVEAA